MLLVDRAVLLKTYEIAFFLDLVSHAVHVLDLIDNSARALVFVWHNGVHGEIGAGVMRLVMGKVSEQEEEHA